MGNPQHRKDLKRSYAERVKPAGVFHIKNTVTGKVLLGSARDLDGRLNRHRFVLNAGAHDNIALQNDWKQYGAAAFVFEILENVQPSDEPDFDIDEALTTLEERWSKRVDPFDGRGYNTSRQLRDV